ncbi:MAG: TonB-dependent receptor [Pseudomonadota bacterium]
MAFGKHSAFKPAVKAALIGSSFLTSMVSTAAAQDGGLEEIVVTATRRETSLQDIGVSVTAFSGDRLKTLNVFTTDEITNQTPGLSLIQAGGAPLAGLIAIRGVAQNDFAPHLESANIVFSDDVYRPSNGSNIANVFDLERVEVLKGPQGTLFGRNATGGLLHYITKDPEEELGGYVDLTVGEFNQVRGEGALNVPLGDIGAFRVAVLANSNDGWIRNAVGADQVLDETLALRTKLLLTPNDRLTIKLQGEYQENPENPAGGGFPVGGFVGEDTLGQFRQPFPGPTDTGYIDADGSVFTGEFDFDGRFMRKDWTVFADIQYEIGNFTFTSITAYSDFENDYEEDNDLTPFDLTIFRQSAEQETFTQEVRVNADYDQLRVTGGFFYLDINGDYFQNFQINNLGNFNQILGAPAFLLTVPVGLNQSANYSLNTSSWSIFAQAEYDLTEQLTVTGGIRYTRDSKDYMYLNSCESLIAEAPACPPAFPPDTLAGAGLIVDEFSEGGVSARLQLDYKVNEDWLIYASYNRGYKAFSYNAGFAGAAPVDGVRFDGETINAYEAGSKLDFLDGNARLNVAAYYYDYNDYQAFDQRGTSFILFNTDARIYGLDVELSANPGYGIDLALGGTYNNTKVSDVPINGQVFDLDAPQAPEFTFNFVAGKSIDIDAGTVRLGFDGAFVGEYFSQLNNAPVTRAGDHWVVNGRLSFAAESGRWSAAVFSRNLFNAERLQYAFDITFPGNGLVEQVYSPPRWIGGSVRINF